MACPRLFDRHCTPDRPGDKMKIHADDSSESRYDLLWSLRPIFISMRIFGIDLLDVTRAPSMCRRWAFTLVGSALIGVVEASNYLLSTEEHPIGLTSSKSWLPVLSRYSGLMWYTLFPSAMLEMLTLRKWNPLWQKMRQMETFLKLPAPFYRRLRTLSAVSVTLICVLVIISKFADTPP